MPEFHLFSTLGTTVIVLGGGLALTLSLFAYRFTIPPVSRVLRSILAVLRALGLFLIVLLIGQPLLTLLSRDDERPVVAVLVDNSRSMTIRDRAGERKTALLEAVRSDALDRLKSLGNLLYGAFDARLRFVEDLGEDTLSFAGGSTDLAAALSALKDTAAKANLQSVVILSDGNSTTGSSPVYEAEELGVPVFTVGIGDTSEQKDVLIRKIVTNSITYVGSKVPVDATVRSSGYGGEKIEVLLRDGARTVDRQTVTLQQGIREYAVPLSFVTEREGIQRLVVETSQLPREVTLQNNRYFFYTKVLKSRMRVLLVAGGPAPDVAFARRALESDKNIELQTFIERDDGQFYERQLNASVLNAAEAIVLVGYPGRTSSDAAISAIAGAVGDGKGVLFVLSRTTDISKLRRLEPLLPMSLPPSGGQEQEVFISVPIDQRSNAIVELSGSQDVWDKLPPLFAWEARFRAKPESEVLGRLQVHTLTTNEPLLLSRNVNGRKSVALLAYGIWRWKTLSAGVPGSEYVLEALLGNAVRWLTTREDERPVRVQPVTELFAGQDPVEFTAQVYDNNYNPLADAEVIVEVKQAEKTDQLNLTAMGNGRFEGSFGPLPEGDYSFIARVFAGSRGRTADPTDSLWRGRPDGQQIAEERGSFSVGELQAEFQETRMNKLLLQRIADRTGGRYYDVKDLGSLPEEIALLPGFRSQEIVRSSEIELWNKSWMLAGIVLVFAAEWFLRKRNGML